MKSVHFLHILYAGFELSTPHINLAPRLHTLIVLFIFITSCTQDSYADADAVSGSGVFFCGLDREPPRFVRSITILL
jgi:hypothetical protein